MNEPVGAAGSVEAVFHVLASRSRRRVLTLLLETTDGTVNFESLARRLAESEQEEALGMVVLGLLHRDLPHLEATGLVEYDMLSETITATNRLTTAEPLLAAAQQFEAETTD